MGSNAKPRSASKVALESFDDLFGGSAAQESGVEQIINAPLAELYTFKDHPFRVEDDEKMEETTESIRQYGVLVPGIARPRAGGGYEILHLINLLGTDNTWRDEQGKKAAPPFQT